MQETHSTSNIQNRWRNEWGAEILFSHGKSNARGVAILIKNNLDAKVTECHSDTSGRILMVKIQIQDVEYVIVNMYAPNKDNIGIQYYSKL